MALFLSEPRKYLNEEYKLNIFNCSSPLTFSKSTLQLLNQDVYKCFDCHFETLSKYLIIKHWKFDDCLKENSSKKRKGLAQYQLHKYLLNFENNFSDQLFKDFQWFECKKCPNKYMQKSNLITHIFEQHVKCKNGRRRRKKYRINKVWRPEKRKHKASLERKRKYVALQRSLESPRKRAIRLERNRIYIAQKRAEEKRCAELEKQIMHETRLENVLKREENDLKEKREALVECGIQFIIRNRIEEPSSGFEPHFIKTVLTLDRAELEKKRKQYEARLERGRRYIAQKRAMETAEQRAIRLEKNRISVARRRAEARGLVYEYEKEVSVKKTSDNAELFRQKCGKKNVKSEVMMN